MPDYLNLPAFDSDAKLLNAIIETPKGARNKFAYDEERGLFRLRKVLSAGMTFPLDFGFIPSTWGEDQGPLDVLVFLEEPTFPGCLVSARLLGVIEAKQTKEGRIVRNDRFLAAAENDRGLKHLQSIKDVPVKILDQIEHFFISYNEAEGKKFKPLRRSGPAAARKLIRAGEANYRNEKVGSGL